MEQVIPEWVKNGADGCKYLAVGGFEALTAEAIRELKAENDRLISEIKSLRDEFQKLNK